jgi:hypothetical protein
MGHRRRIVDYWVPSAADFKRTDFEVKIHNHRSTRYGGSLYGLLLLGSLQIVMKMKPQGILRAIRTYSEHEMFYFGARDLATFLRKLDKIIPRAYYNPRNPNNGRLDYELRFGRENSPVLYIDRTREHFTAEECKRIQDAAMEMDCPPDEWTCVDGWQEGQITTIRIWWD